MEVDSGLNETSEDKPTSTGDVNFDTLSRETSGLIFPQSQAGAGTRLCIDLTQEWPCSDDSVDEREIQDSDILPQSRAKEIVYTSLNLSESYVFISPAQLPAERFIFYVSQNTHLIFFTPRGVVAKPLSQCSRLEDLFRLAMMFHIAWWEDFDKRRAYLKLLMVRLRCLVGEKLIVGRLGKPSNVMRWSGAGGAR